MEWDKKLNDSGRVEVQYFLADEAEGSMGGFSNVNYDFAEQLAEDLATMPVAGQQYHQGASIGFYGVSRKFH